MSSTVDLPMTPDAERGAVLLSRSLVVTLESWIKVHGEAEGRAAANARSPVSILHRRR
jgi:hypothetical protein